MVVNTFWVTDSFNNLIKPKDTSPPTKKKPIHKHSSFLTISITVLEGHASVSSLKLFLYNDLTQVSFVIHNT